MKKTKEKRGFEGVVKAIKSPAIHNLTPAVSSGSAAAELGYVYCKTNRHPTTVEFVCCVGCSSCFRQSLKQEGRAAKLGLSEVENCSIPTNVENVREETPLDGVFLFSCPVCPGKQNILASLLQKIEQTRERGIFLLYGIFIPSEEPDAQGGAECEH